MHAYVCGGGGGGGPVTASPNEVGHVCFTALPESHE